MTNQTQPSRKTTKSTVIISPKHSPFVKAWRDLTSLEKMCAASRAAMSQNGRSVTINIEQKLEAILWTDPDPILLLQKRMNKELTKAGMNGLPILLALEITKTPPPRLHLHGTFVPSGFPVSAVGQAMRRAVGYIPGRAGSRQFSTKALFNADGWVRYFTTDFSYTRKKLGLADTRLLWWISHSMTQLAKSHHDQERLRCAENLPNAPDSLAG